MSEKNLRVAVLGTRGIPDVMGGVETHCQALYPRLVAKGHSIIIFARKGYVQQKCPYDFQGVQVIPIWAPKRKSLEAICHTIWGILQIVRHRSSFDLLHIHAIGPSLLVPVARLLGIPVVMTHHGQDYDRQKWGKAAKTVLRIGERLGCRFAGAVITVSKHIRTCIRDLYGSEGIYIPNGVVLPEIIPSGENLRRWQMLRGKYILAVGRFVPEKCFHDLLEAFSRVNTEWKLVIAGDADHPDEYSSKLKASAAEDKRVVLTGFIKGKELGELYSNAGLFVLPSSHEGLPIALLEAMSYNIPVLASDIPANRELIEDKETFRQGDVSVLASRIADIVVAPTQPVAKRGIVEAEFNWDVVAEQTEQVYLKVSIKK